MNAYTPAPDLLKDRVILVTGAGQGLGRAVSLAAAAHGATVVLVGRNVGKLEAVYDEIVAAGGPEPAIFGIDLAAAQDKDYEALAQGLRLQLTRLDGLVHCAAFFYNTSPLALQTSEQWLNYFKVNTLAPFALTRACEPLLRQSPDASVIVVGETHGHAPAAFWGGFAVSKAALEAYMKIQAAEWRGQDNLRINMIIPGPVNTPQRARSHPGELKTALPQPANIVPYFLALLGPDGRGHSGEIVDCAKGRGQASAQLA